LHRALDRAAGDVLAFAFQQPPDFPRAIELEVLLEHARDLRHQAGVALGPCRQTRRIGPPGGMGAIGRWGDRQHLADRLDPMFPTVIVDERDHGLCRRLSSASLPSRQMSSFAGRGQNTPTPCAGNRWPGEARGSHAPAPSAWWPSPSSHRAYDQAAALQGWQLPEVFQHVRHLLEARIGNRGKREFIQVLRQMEAMTPEIVTEAVREAIRLEARRGVAALRHASHPTPPIHQARANPVASG
jgi:hypothetical protein